MHFEERPVNKFWCIDVNNDGFKPGSDPEKTCRKVVLIGNPNVGKSTLFNALTGMNQHTGNWPGKTVEVSSGRYGFKGRSYLIIDLPGTYSLLSCSEEERIAVEYLRQEKPDCTVVVVDATCLERSLLLALQVLELTDPVVVCVNLMDEAKRKGICIDLSVMERELGVPVVASSAADCVGIQVLQETVRNVCDGFSRFSC